jgi:hypothetical protein
MAALGNLMKWIIFLIIGLANVARAEQGACFGKMKYKHLDKGIELTEGVAVWDLPKGVKEADDFGSSYVVTFPAVIADHKFMWADVYFGKDRKKPIFETSLKVSGEQKLMGKFTTSLEDAVFYVRVVYMLECSDIILEQRFNP